MAGIQLKTMVRLSASSIMEVIVAMVLIVVVFGIAMQIYANVIRLSLTTKKIKAQSIVNEVMIQSVQKAETGKHSSMIGGFRIEEDVTNYQSNIDLVVVAIAAYDDNQEKVAGINKIIDVSR